MLFLHLLPSIFESYCAVEYRVLRCRIVVGCEITDTLELEFLALCGILDDKRFELGMFNHHKRLGIEHLAEVAVGLGCRVLYIKETVVQTHLCINGMLGRYPVECAFHLARCSGEAAAALGIVGAVDSDDIAVGISLDIFCTLDDIRTFETHFLTGSKAEELFGDSP